MKRVSFVNVAMSGVILIIGIPGLAQTGRRGSGHRPRLLTCQYKTVGVPGQNGESHKLSLRYDREQIATAMRSNRAYEVFDRYDGRGVIVSRVFNGVKYNLVFDQYGGFNLNTNNLKGYPGRGTVAWGERCDTPDRVLRRNVYRMIEDLPLEPPQEAELKRYVLVMKAVNGGLLF